MSHDSPNSVRVRSTRAPSFSYNAADRTWGLTGASSGDSNSEESQWTAPASPSQPSFRHSSYHETSPLSQNADDTASERRIRIARVMSKQQHRISAHIQEFSKINVIVSDQDVSLEIMVDRQQTIEHLAKMAETQYAYKYFMHEEPPKQSPAGTNRPQRDPLQIGQVYNSGMLALKFDDVVGDVLGYIDTVTVINAFEGDSINRTMHIVEEDPASAEEEALLLSSGGEDAGSPSHRSVELPAIESTVSLEESMSEVFGKPMSAEGRTPSAAIVATTTSNTAQPPIPATPRRRSSNLRTQHNTQSELRERYGAMPFNMPLVTLDDRLQAILRNKFALRFFSDFCVEEYTIENLLFWLDVEIFQSLDDEIRTLYGKYIYMTYLAANAPLQLNIPAEIRNDIPRPNDDTPDVTTYDEAQEQVYAMLKGHSFSRFERSPKWQQYQQAKTTERLEYLRGRVTGTFAASFASNVEQARSIVQLLETASYGDVPQELAAIIGDKALTIAERESFPKTSKFKETVLARALTQYFPMANRILEGYFSVDNRSTWGEKQRRMHKQNKLAKFFGELPSVELIQQQIFAASEPYLAKMLPEERGSCEDVLKRQSVVSEQDPSSKTVRLKKKEKLETFFGNALPSQQKRVQQIFVPDKASPLGLTAAGDSDTGSIGSEEEELLLPVLETTNDLDPHQRRILRKRTNKISNMLGHSLDERTISQAVTNPTFHTAKSTGNIPDVPSSPVPTLPRSGFHASSINIGSSDTLADSEAESKTAQKKRLDKLSNIMGHRIGSNHLAEAQAASASVPPSRRPLTQEEKRQFQKKATKLERLLGDMPPSEQVIASVPSDQPGVACVAKSLAGLTYLVRNAQDVVELIDTLSQISDAPVAPSGSGNDRDSVVSASESATDTDTLPPLGKHIDFTKENRQKRLNKLRKFFGGTSVEAIIESQLLRDIVRSMEEEIADTAQLEQLRKEVTTLREEVRRRSNQFLNEWPVTEQPPPKEESRRFSVSFSRRNSSTAPRSSTGSTPSGSDASGSRVSLGGNAAILLGGKVKDEPVSGV
ncbi:hypothetical protein BC832DRAFT_588702 [Gaertneriomyces semiglobifer]|nr:hypothetical protein BC832DRAFT_588702 [Gaertneriomyces semiglobifer]